MTTVVSLHNTATAIEAAFRRLPAPSPERLAELMTTPEGRDRLAMTAVTEDARQAVIVQLRKLSLDIAKAKHATPEVPARFRHCGRAQAERSLQAVINSTAALATAIDALPFEAIQLIANLPPERAWLHPSGLATLARDAGARAKEALKGIGTIALQTDKRTPSQPQKDAILAIAIDGFIRLTGKKPTMCNDSRKKNRRGRCGPFVQLVDELFDALGITAVASSAAQTAIDRMRVGPRSWPPERYPPRDRAQTPQPDWAAESDAAIRETISEYKNRGNS